MSESRKTDLGEGWISKPTPAAAALLAKAEQDEALLASHAELLASLIGLTELFKCVVEDEGGSIVDLSEYWRAVDAIKNAENLADGAGIISASGLPWVSVDERLPVMIKNKKHSEDVLVCFQDDDKEGFVVAYYTQSGKFIESWEDYQTLHSVTKWIELVNSAHSEKGSEKGGEKD